MVDLEKTANRQEEDILSATTLASIMQLFLKISWSFFIIIIILTFVEVFWCKDNQRTLL